MSKTLPAAAATLVVAIAAALGGCASAQERPVEQLASAETSIEFAEQNGAPEYGAEALGRARSKLEAADRAADDGDYETAMQLAVEADLDAQLSASQASRRKVEIALQEVNDSLATLRQEVERNSNNSHGEIL